jgi:mono/diheme cytochrome c family protein
MTCDDLSRGMREPLKRNVVLLLVTMASLAGCRATPPGKLETAVMTRVKRSITVRGKELKNPLPDTPANVKRGQEAFSHYCVACHGLDGQNTGVPFADRMSPPVPPLNSPAVETYADGQLYWILQNGVSPSGMPSSKGILSDQELWSIVTYIRHLPPAGSLGEPAMYSGDDNSTVCPPASNQGR